MLPTEDLKTPGESTLRALKSSLAQVESEIARLTKVRVDLSQAIRSLEVVVGAATGDRGHPELSLEAAIDMVMPSHDSDGETVERLYNLVMRLPTPVTSNKLTKFNVKNVIQRKHASRGWERANEDRPTKWRRSLRT